MNITDFDQPYIRELLAVELRTCDRIKREVLAVELKESLRKGEVPFVIVSRLIIGQMLAVMEVMDSAEGYVNGSPSIIGTIRSAMQTCIRTYIKGVITVDLEGKNKRS